ncbi:MAG: GNAT family N-acetyltransferase [Anaerolineae bacterium]
MTVERLEIRPLTVADAETAAELKLSVWPKEASDPKQIRAAVQSPSHQAFLALVGDGQNPAGFVSCFLTTSQAGHTRWEIDLLAVHPDFRRRGIASKLIETAVQAGQEAHASLSRGLIATDNIGSQKSFASQGFTSDGVVQTLYICSEPVTSGIQNKHHAHFVPVSTFLYDGFWLEGLLSPAAFPAAHNHCFESKLNIVGLLIPETDSINQAEAKEHGFKPAGTFHWWQRSL